MRASHALQTRTETKESLRVWRAEPSVVVEISTRAGAGSAEAAVEVAGSDAKQGDLDARLSVLRFFVERLTGKRMQLFDTSALGGASNQSQPDVRADFGIELEVTRVYSEQEQMQFTAAGTVRTEDGAAFQFELNLSASRSYQLQESASLRSGEVQRKDPLIFNFTGSAPQLSETRFSFDIDADGTVEELPMLATGNGFLALDISANGKIDSGAELFGALTGDGFAELSAYDDDNNRVIDENDSVFARLRIFAPAQGDNAASLETLRERGVGAIFLDRVQTPFTLRTSTAELGAVRATGIYLSELGQPGIVQQIDLVV